MTKKEKKKRGYKKLNIKAKNLVYDERIALHGKGNYDKCLKIIFFKKKKKNLHSLNKK